ncbi:hypothetical protein M3Y99_01851400 [Aphelenchoides fujianensis]|nr:hypothetical protein M3Y99_01851400 [Aphelenchoides fujianensis]
MSTGRRSNAGVNRRRFSPYPEEERKPSASPDDHRGGARRSEAVVEEDAVALREIGSHIASQDFASNAEIISATPLLTMDIQAVDVIDIYNNPMEQPDLQNTLAGFAIMVNRLIFENRYLLRELQALKSSGGGIGMSPFDALVFKKSNGGDGIPPVCLNNLLEIFDQNCTRRNETAVHTLRRLVKFLLENVIPKPLHSKFTVRERGGYERLIELPLELTSVIKEICLESVNLLDARTEDDKDRRNDLSESLFRFMKFALQELRRTPRKAKIPVSRR